MDVVWESPVSGNFKDPEREAVCVCVCLGVNV